MPLYFGLMKIAVIKTGGKQYVVKEGDRLRIEKLPNVDQGKKVTFKEVLLLGDTEGQQMTVGTPHVAGTTVEGEVIKNGRAKKVIVRKFKAKVRYSRTYGHRQPYSEVKITSIA